MSKKRGLSLEDKRRVILSIYHDQKVPFNLKEIESIASRMGVVQQTIKDVNQSLVDDSMVLVDKIGSSNFFWSFPSKAFEDLKNSKSSAEAGVVSCGMINSELSKRIDDLKSIRCGTDREAKLRRLESLSKHEIAIEEKLCACRANDPMELQRILKQVENNREGANRWTENIWTVKKFLTKKRGISGKEADKHLGIDNTFDLI